MKRNKTQILLHLQCVIDYGYFLLNKMREDNDNNSSINKLIDRATGYEKEQIKIAKQIIRNIERYKKLYYKLNEANNEQRD